MSTFFTTSSLPCNVGEIGSKQQKENFAPKKLDERDTTFSALLDDDQSTSNLVGLIDEVTLSEIDDKVEAESKKSLNQEKLTAAIKTVLECLGEDVDREGIQRTPARAAKALQFFTSGYCQTVQEVIGEGVFNEDTSSDMVLVKNIDIHSMCEHHMVPFSGKCTIAYIPNGRILGLSKLARISNLFARRFQVQERLTRQIAEAIMESVGALGVAVTIEAT